MRIQPPKNQNKFTLKLITRKTIISYIGSHRLVPQDITLDEYFKDNKLTAEQFESFITMFPYNLQVFARIYFGSINTEYDLFSN